ncbi:MAG: hypothetical protein OEV27_05070 [Nitrospira sp.]|nr:hypothetical protein [Nitrospira sp.]MDH4250543.1 hypothetical protein [Nitrospira sp.]MDH4341865.1 hypothetical protein [Nitrospira sp.]MDH5336704.1 hypothetical protein [Nitrospira sp.]
MNIARRNILPVILGGVGILFTMTPFTATAGSKDGKKSGAYSSAAAEVMVSTPETASLSTTDRSDHKPGPAWKTIGGTLKHIKGDVYTVEDYDGNQVQLYISRETKQLRGSKKVGDRVRAEITHGRFANSIQ